MIQKSVRAKKGVVLAACAVTMAVVMALCTALAALASGASQDWKAELRAFDFSRRLDTVGEDFLRGADVAGEDYQSDFYIYTEDNTLTVKSRDGVVLLTVITDGAGNVYKWKYGE
ncbi:MAG: hypothetical protein PHW77_06685 [Eubacteriales bacterium]|nr:hypothetical protein [Eubacteriales bacterium]